MNRPFLSAVAAVDGRVPVTVRPMVAADLAAVAEIERSSSPDPWTLSLLEGELALPDDANHWLVAETTIAPTAVPGTGRADTTAVRRSEPASVVGFAGVMVVADDAHILNLVVDSAHRRRGIGHQLLARLLRGAVVRGATAATLEVRAGNQDAQQLYTRFGFRRAGRRRRYYADGTDAVIMWSRRLEFGGFGTAHWCTTVKPRCMDRH